MEIFSQDIINKIMIYSSHPLADLFKKELEEELEDHFRILKEGPGLELNWCADDEWSFAHEYFRLKLYSDGWYLANEAELKKSIGDRPDHYWDIYTNLNRGD